MAVAFSYYSRPLLLILLWSPVTGEQPLQVARCTKIINADTDDPKYIINVKQFAKFVVELSDQVAPTDIEEGMRVGVDRNKYQIHIPLPPKIDPTVTMMQVEEKPDVTYSDVGGCKEQIEKLREVVETPLLHVSGTLWTVADKATCSQNVSGFSPGH